VRRAFAESLHASPALTEAFAAVEREWFLPPPPWLIAQPFNTEQPYRPTTDLADVYSDALLAIDATRQLNNGQPSAHAKWSDAVLPKSGESVLHIGCGTGYYTAVLAALRTRVVAYEIDPELAARARATLPTVEVINGAASTAE
jgi:protein-L-isoaspartate(D-aspartate) O-methyltransferase